MSNWGVVRSAAHHEREVEQQQKCPIVWFSLV